MQKVAEFYNETDEYGTRLRYVFYVGKDTAVIRVKKGDSMVMEDLHFSMPGFRNFADTVLKVASRVAELEGKPMMKKNTELKPVERAEMMESLLDTFDENDVRRLLNTDRFENVQKMRRMVEHRAKHDLNQDKFEFKTRDDVQATKEIVLQKIYEEFGSSWFTKREFKQVYDRDFDTNTARNWLSTLTGSPDNYIYKREVDEDEVDDGRIRYMYRLSKHSLNVVDKYGSFTSEDNPGWQRKKTMLKG